MRRDDRERGREMREEDQKERLKRKQSVGVVREVKRRRERQRGIERAQATAEGRQWCMREREENSAGERESD